MKLTTVAAAIKNGHIIVLMRETVNKSTNQKPEPNHAKDTS